MAKDKVPGGSQWLVLSDYDREVLSGLPRPSQIFYILDLCRQAENSAKEEGEEKE